VNDNPYFVIGQVLFYVVLGALTVWMNRRTGRKATERETEQQALKTEVIQLRKDAADNGVVMEDLRKQVKTLNHYQGMYETLNESHGLLQTAHNLLKQTVDGQGAELDKLRAQLDAERTNLVGKEAALHRVERERDQAIERAEEAEISNRELRNIIGLFAAEYKEAQRKTASEPEPREGHETAQAAPGETVTNDG